MIKIFPADSSTEFKMDIFEDPILVLFFSLSVFLGRVVEPLFADNSGGWVTVGDLNRQGMEPLTC